MIRKLCSLMTAFLLAAPAVADPPQVAVDIAPVHSLVAMVTQGRADPGLIVSANVSPHGFAMRPSQARLLQQADLVVWLGPTLTPWLDKSIDTLAPDAVVLGLLEHPDTHLLGFKEDDEVDGAEDKGHGHGHEEGHGRLAGMDPHAWLDPQNAIAWLGIIADALDDLDPENGALYRANASAAQAVLINQTREINAMLGQMRAQPYVTYHDAYQYFEVRFGLTSVGSVAASDAASPSPAHLAKLRDVAQNAGVACAFSEPQFDAKLLQTLAGAEDLRVIPLDPMGVDLTPGADLYPEMLGNMARAMARCVAPG